MRETDGEHHQEIPKAMSKKKELLFLLTDLSYEIPEEKDLPIIYLYGRRKEGEVLVKVHGFAPYFYVKKTPELPFILQNDPKINQWQRATEERTLRQYFWGGTPIRLVKVLGTNPRKVREISRTFEKLGIKTFETDIPFLKRFLIDNDIKCLNVIKVRSSQLRTAGRRIYLEVGYQDVSRVSEEELPRATDFYPLRLLSLNIKIARENESFEELMQKKDKPILAITTILGTSTKPAKAKVFFLEDYSPEGERKMIQKFLVFLQEVQPDILCTFHGDNFDLPYLLHRMKLLQVPSHAFSLFNDEPCYYSKSLHSFRMMGRMVFDLALRTWGIHPPSGKKGLYDIAEVLLGRGAPATVRTNHSNYYKQTPTFEEVNTARDFLHLWRQGFCERRKEQIKALATRCLYDAKLIYDLFWELGMSGWIETLRVTGFPPAEGNSCTERLNGEFELMRYMRRKGIIIPKRPDADQVEKNRLIRQQYPHEGGTVLYPKGTLHIGVLIADFQSMYPSVMIAQNIGGETIKQWVEGSDYGDPKKLFEQQSRSCLAIMEKALIKKRMAKKKQISQLQEQLKQTTDAVARRTLEEKIAILQREQNSMKIVANSMYGAHFYIRSRFYTQTLAAAIANSARDYLLGIEKQLEILSKKLVPCELIYGDTDSAFIKIHAEELFTKIHAERDAPRREQLIAKLMLLVNALLKAINDNLPSPVQLKFEDVAYRIIFKPERKKAYSYSSLLSNEFVIKGFEAVRSDWSPLARQAQRKVLEILLNYPKATAETTLTEFQLAKRFLIALGVKVLQMPSELLLPKVVILSPIRQPPENYKGKTPAVVAFSHFAQMEGVDVSKAWMDYDKFPWVIVAGKGSIYERARHPKFAEEIDREHYVKEMLRCCEGLGVKVSLAEVKGALPTGRLPHAFERARDKGLLLPAEEKSPLSIEPIKTGELEWQRKSKKPKRRSVRRKPAGQLALAQFSYLPTKEEEKGRTKNKNQTEPEQGEGRLVPQKLIVK